MSTQDWQADNAHYLSIALEWLRLRLMRLVQAQAEAPGTPTAPAVIDEQSAQAANEMTSLESGDPPPALVGLGQRLGLARFERDVLLLCAALELDTRIAALCARGHCCALRWNWTRVSRRCVLAARMIPSDPIRRLRWHWRCSTIRRGRH
jgi:hypothetical protein